MAARKPVMLKPADLERMKSDKNTVRSAARGVYALCL